MKFWPVFALLLLPLAPLSAHAETLVPVCGLGRVSAALDSGLVSKNATPRRFDVHDMEIENGEKFFFRSEVQDDGGLELDIATRDPVTKQTSHWLWAEELFDEMMHHFKETKTPIKYIAGNWYDGTNLKLLNELTRGGTPIEQAALNTWTGRQARRFGYNKVKVVTKKGAPGRWQMVVVEFYQGD